MARSIKPPRNLLEMVPLHVHEWKEAEDGNIHVLIPRYGRSRIGRWVAEVIGRPHIIVKLDPIGSAVWKGCDGETTVGQISMQLERQFGETIAPWAWRG